MRIRHAVIFASILLTFALNGCGDDEISSSNGVDTLVGDTTLPDAVVDTTLPDAVADTTPDTTDTTDTTDVAAPDAEGECGPSNLVACQYPSRGATVIKREGIATTEPETGRSLPLVARIPALAGPLPVVIWSHGGGFPGGGEQESVQWGETFAAHGYVVIHVGHSPLGTEAQTLCELASVPTAECVPSDDEDSNGLVAIGKAYDIKAVLDDLPRLSQISVDNGGPSLDLDRVAVAGWSGGSRGPMVLMGAEVRPTAGAPLFTNPDARPKAAIFMSPAGAGFGGWFDTGTATSWDAMRGPTFGATGTNDVKPDKLDLNGPVRREYFVAQPADDERWLLYSNLEVGVGGHGTYNLGDLDASDARLKRLSQAIASTARAFLDATLKDDAAARAWLESNKARVLAGNAEWLHR